MKVELMRIDRWDKEITIYVEGIRVTVDHDDVDHADAKRIAKLIVSALRDIEANR